MAKGGCLESVLLCRWRCGGDGDGECLVLLTLEAGP